MKLNTNISIENVITIITLVCSMILAFGFMQYDVDMIRKELETKELKEVAKKYHEASKDGKITKAEQQAIAKECMDVMMAVVKMVWKF